MPETAPRSPDIPTKTWRDTVAVYLEGPTLRMLLLGFSAGLPLVLVLRTLSFWLREAGIERASIGYLSWIGLAYAFKFVWSPLVDRLPIPWVTRRMGRRRSWLLMMQLAVVVGLLGMAASDPRVSMGALVGFALLVAFGSATQDIALDAYRIESASSERQAALAAAYLMGYRLAMLWAGAGVLWIAARAETPNVAAYQFEAWRVAYCAMAGSMLVGIVTVLKSAEPAPTPVADTSGAAPGHGLAEWIRSAVVGPFADFFQRHGWQAALILGLIALYRISDVVMGVMANPFYVDMGYTKDDVAMVTKIYGLVMTLLGGFVGGAIATRWGIYRVLMLGAALSAGTNLMFAWLATRGHDVSALVAVISLDNFAGGLAQAAFIAYMSSLTNVAYTATQYAMFSSIMQLIPELLAGYSGWMVDHIGYQTFFVSTALMGVPVLALVWWLGRRR